jgi:hypothetical protein
MRYRRFFVFPGSKDAFLNNFCVSVKTTGNYEMKIVKSDEIELI